MKEMDDSTNKAYREVSWKRYLLKTEQPRVIRFLESRGNEVFYQVSKSIENAITNRLDWVVLLIHPNMKNIIKINKKDYVHVLNRANEWFVSKEKYEICSQIKIIKSKLENQPRKTPIRFETLI
tara:strand:+ start:267 stop:638 length:372 start_codon:yes stop_codon:yes gene_type:complete